MQSDRFRALLDETRRSIDEHERRVVRAATMSTALLVLGAVLAATGIGVWLEAMIRGVSP